jgi:hypothetical protein
MYKNNVWNPWTEKSLNTKFKSTEQAVGDGEQKLGSEYDVHPQGQNISYDLDVLGEKWEVKKLDSDDSFRLGVEISSSYRIIIDAVIRILEQIISLEEHLFESDTSELILDCIIQIKSYSGSSSTLLIEGLRKNEVSSSNLNKANDIIEIIKKIIIIDERSVELFSSFDGVVRDYDLIQSFEKLEFENITIEEKLKTLNCDLNYFTRLQLTSKVIDYLNVFENISLKEKLNELVRSIFTSIKLVLVHKTKGYKPITDLTKIYCNRITSGNPRCKLLN